MAKKSTPYSLYADAVKKQTELEIKQQRLFDGWMDLSGEEIPTEEAEQKKAEWAIVRKEALAAKEESYAIYSKHMKPFEETAAALSDGAYYRRTGVSAYKKARQKLWDEERKMRNAVRVSRGGTALKLDRSNYHLDFE